MRRFLVVLSMAFALAGCTGAMCDDARDSLVLPAVY